MRFLLLLILGAQISKSQKLDHRNRQYHSESISSQAQTSSSTTVAICNNDTVYFDFQGNVLAEKTIVNCINSFDSLLYPGLAYGSIETVNITIYINNLISIQEVSNTVSLDFFVNLKWVDSRLSMPNLWTQLKKQGKW